jgi:hypothetical protein
MFQLSHFLHVIESLHQHLVILLYGHVVATIMMINVDSYVNTWPILVNAVIHGHVLIRLILDSISLRRCWTKQILIISDA